MAKEKKISPARQRIIDNCEIQKQKYHEEGYEECQETISVVKANVMAFVTAGPFAALGVVVWVFVKRGGEGSFSLGGMACFCALIFLSIFIHELLHGIVWSFQAEKKWKSIYFGVMWEYLTPYCHCREPLRPRQYLTGVLAPFVVLGAGLYAAALLSGSYMLLALSLINILSAGGDTTIACMEWKYLKQNDSCCILDHPTDCGFTAFVKNTNQQSIT